MVNLILIFKQQKHLRFHVNLNTIAVLLVPAFYTISPLWAADKGMAIFGILRYLPLSLYVLTLMQYSREQLRRALSLVPLCCAWMTLSSCLLLLIPGIDAYVTVKERLSGFMQYPNTFAAFLLAGLVLQGTKESRSKSDLMTDAILIYGIILSGSQTGFILLFIALAGIVLIQKDPKVFVTGCHRRVRPGTCHNYVQTWLDRRR